MRTQRALSVAGVSLCIATAALLMGGCSSVPTPAEADGSSRVPANDPERMQALQQRVHADRALLTENNLLRAQVEALQAKLAEMTTIVRDALMLPPAAKAPMSLAPHAVPQAMAAPDLPTYAYSTHGAGVVIRVFHPFAHTAFEPSEQVAQALRASVPGADLIEVRGYTDSNVVNAHDQQIAIERAEKARGWLIENGADPTKIRTKHFTAGHFLTDNRTPQGRSLNRRVEVDIRSQQLAGSKLASND